MIKSGDKYGDGKFDYAVKSSANTSLVFYSEIVEGDKKESMTPKVCFEFCRTMPDMQFFGLIYGRECYCSHYYKKTTGEVVIRYEVREPKAGCCQCSDMNQSGLIALIAP